MHEVRVTVSRGSGSAIAKAALEAGIQRITVCPVQVIDSHADAEIVSVETSTPRAKAFLHRVLSSGEVDLGNTSITTREVRAILDGDPVRELTYPAVEPTVEVFQDLWQLNHLTPSFIARALAAAILLGYGMLRADPVSIVVAALFLPFMSQVLGLAFGAWAGDWKLAAQSAAALAVSLIISVLAGITLAVILGGPLQFDGFKSPVLSVMMSLVIGAAAGLSTADDAGRRYLIGVAAAAQSGIFAVWAGFALVLGFPDRATTIARLLTLPLNVCAIGIAGCVSYALIGLRRGSAQAAWRRG
jgi:hypothetical protein